MSDLLPKYKSHKEVQAVKIISIGVMPIEESDECANLLDCRLNSSATVGILVSQEYMDKHKPKAGGYYVKYEDGYESFSPAEAFEGGYTLVKEEV